MFRSYIASIHAREEGHIAPAVGGLLGGVGAVVLAIGAAGDRGPMTIIGGIVLAAGILGATVGHHSTIDKDLYGRIDKLNGK